MNLKYGKTSGLWLLLVWCCVGGCKTKDPEPEPNFVVRFTLSDKTREWKYNEYGPELDKDLTNQIWLDLAESKASSDGRYNVFKLRLYNNGQPYKEGLVINQSKGSPYNSLFLLIYTEDALLNSESSDDLTLKIQKFDTANQIMEVTFEGEITVPALYRKVKLTNGFARLHYDIN